MKINIVLLHVPTAAKKCCHLNALTNMNPATGERKRKEHAKLKKKLTGDKNEIKEENKPEERRREKKERRRIREERKKLAGV